MVDEQLSGALRDLPGRVLNVSVEERQLIFRNVSAVLRNPGKQSRTNLCFIEKYKSNSLHFYFQTKL
uniref:Uncharacterized protein LOC108045087 n=1 Tax=Drosophila rhopaloa TaxID=1041015 RepID=A0A6P4F340_DRORH